MNNNDLLTIIKVILPGVNDVDFIKKFGLWIWIIVFLAKADRVSAADPYSKSPCTAPPLISVKLCPGLGAVA